MIKRNHSTVGVLPGTRLHRIERIIDRSPHVWRLWIASRDFTYGTYIELRDDGSVITVSVRDGEGDELLFVRPTDATIKQRQGEHNEDPS